MYSKCHSNRIHYRNIMGTHETIGSNPLEKSCFQKNKHHSEIANGTYEYFKI